MLTLQRNNRRQQQMATHFIRVPIFKCEKKKKKKAGLGDGQTF